MIILDRREAIDIGLNVGAWPCWFGGFWPAKKDWEKTPQKQTYHKTGPYVSLDFPNK